MRAVAPPGSAVIGQLRSYVTAFTEFTVLFADWMRLPTSDGTALAEIVWADREGAPLSAARLSRHLGMTSGATNALVNRLERAGHVVRSRESSDRRIVSLRPTPASRERTEQFAVRAAPDVEAVLRGADPAALEVVESLLSTLTSTMVAVNRRLREERFTQKASDQDLPAAEASRS